jgi:hypothetical protein
MTVGCSPAEPAETPNTSPAAAPITAASRQILRIMVFPFCNASMSSDPRHRNARTHQCAPWLCFSTSTEFRTGSPTTSGRKGGPVHRDDAGHDPERHSSVLS